MPRAALTAGAHRTDSSVERWDALKLDTNEEARIWIPDEDNAWMEMVHAVRLPVFEEDGTPARTTKDTRMGPKEVFEDTWLSNPICLGREEVLSDPALELDVEQCPTCAGVRKMLDAGITEAAGMKPKRRFAIPLVVYATSSKRDASKLRSPLGLKILVWSLSEWTYRKLDDARKGIVELLELDGVQATKLQMVDLAVHCESGQWQKYDKVTALRCARRNEQVREAIDALWGNTENRPSDEQLEAACGRKSGREWMQRDIDDAIEAWTRAWNWGNGGPLDESKGGNKVSGAPARQLDEALDDLLFESGASGSAAQDPLAGHPGGMDEFAAATPAASDDILFASSSSADAQAGTPGSWPSDDDLFSSGPPAPAASNSAASALDTATAGTSRAAASVPGRVASFDDIMPG